LELDPNVSDWPTIEAAIRKKQTTWSKHINQGSQDQRMNAERYMKYLSEMETLFKDPEASKQEANACRKELKKAKIEAVRRLDDSIQFIQENSVTPKLVEKLVRQSKGTLTEKEVEDRLKQNGKTIQKDGGKKRKPLRLKKLEASFAKTIRKELDTIKLESLYDFLNIEDSPKVNNRCSPKALYERADAIYKKLNRSGKTDPDTTLRINLTGKCKTVFKNDEEKERYDNTYAEEALSDLESFLEIAGDKNFISQGSLQSLVNRGRDLGVNEVIVQEFIYDYARRRKWGIQETIEADTKRLPICGYCATLASSPGETHCKKCGEALTEPCPRCGQINPTENAACGRCGCRIGDAPVVKSLLRKGNELNRKGLFKEAVQSFDSALDYWDDWKPAKEAKAFAEKKIRESITQMQEISSLVADRKLQEANTKLNNQLQSFDIEKTSQIHDQIKKGMGKARNAYEAGCNLESSGKCEEAFSKYEEALSFCVDYTPAIAAMAKNPPPAPESLRIKRTGTTYRLLWPKVKAQGEISYKVLRKIQGAPANANDGEAIAETKMDFCDDPAPIPGTVYYYAICTLRAGTPSKQLAVCGPTRLTTEVTNLKVRVGNKQVFMNWELPVGASNAEVWRKTGGIPSRQGDGEKVKISQNSLVDTGLLNNCSYGYLIVSAYPGLNNSSKMEYSKGHTTKAIPVEPPSSVKNLKAERQGHTIILSWTPPTDKGKIQIRQTQNLPEFSLGQTISLDDADAFGIPLSSISEGSARVTLNTQGIVYFIPLSVVAHTAVLGKPISVTTVDDVLGLSSTITGKNIVLTWTWPVGAFEVLIAYRTNGYPSSPTDAGATKISVTKREYEEKNFFEIRTPELQKYYFTVFVRGHGGGIYSQGVNLLETMGQQSIVCYKVRVKKKFFSKKPEAAWVEFQSDNTQSLKGLLVTLKANYPPISKNDGETIIQCDDLSFHDGFAEIRIPDSFLGRKGYLKVFFDKDSAVKEVRLMPAGMKNLRLG